MIRQLNPDFDPFEEDDALTAECEDLLEGFFFFGLEYNSVEFDDLPAHKPACPPVRKLDSRPKTS